MRRQFVLEAAIGARVVGARRQRLRWSPLSGTGWGWMRDGARWCSGMCDMP